MEGFEKLITVSWVGFEESEDDFIWREAGHKLFYHGIGDNNK